MYIHKHLRFTVSFPEEHLWDFLKEFGNVFRRKILFENRALLRAVDSYEIREMSGRDKDAIVTLTLEEGLEGKLFEEFIEDFCASHKIELGTTKDKSTEKTSALKSAKKLLEFSDNVYTVSAVCCGYGSDLRPFFYLDFGESYFRRSLRLFPGHPNYTNDDLIPYLTGKKVAFKPMEREAQYGILRGDFGGVWGRVQELVDIRHEQAFYVRFEVADPRPKGLHVTRVNKPLATALCGVLVDHEGASYDCSNNHFGYNVQSICPACVSICDGVWQRHAESMSYNYPDYKNYKIGQGHPPF